MYKTKLQEICQKRQWGLPKYCVMKNGSDHSPKFNSSVTVNGLSFDDSNFPSNSSKQSQNNAAKFAFLHFTDSSLHDEPVKELDKVEQVENVAKVETEDSAENGSNSNVLNSSKNMGKSESYLHNQRVRVYTSYPNIAFPKGIIVLPVTDNRWVAVNLEFPNE
ncbi:uncharacterized protein LOC126657412 isoform X2 [Mercurialis annua]|nr:uncharacterized protein LOC126657412 isoform X2 [Mercurialis annua]